MLKIRPSIAILAATVLLGLERQACAFATNPAAAGASDVAAASGGAASAGAATAAASAASSVAPVLVQLPDLTVAFVVAFFLAGVLLTVRSLNRSKWSLAQALSEKDPSAVAAAADAQPPGSSSRLIAFLGSIGMLAMMMGFGLYALWAFFNGKASEAKDAMQAASSYILYGSAMYAPYAFNQLKSAVKS